MSERPTRTFDFGEGSVEGSTFSQIESSADEVLRAGSSKNTVYELIRHKPWRTADENVNWIKVGVIAGVVAVPVAIVFGVLSIS